MEINDLRPIPEDLEDLRGFEIYKNCVCVSIKCILAKHTTYELKTTESEISDLKVSPSHTLWAKLQYHSV